MKHRRTEFGKTTGRFPRCRVDVQPSGWVFIASYFDRADYEKESRRRYTCPQPRLCLHTPTDEIYWLDSTKLRWPWQQRPASIAWDEMLHIGSAKFAIQWQRFCGGREA